MNVMHLIFSLNTGGAETMLVDIINQQLEHASVTLVIVNKGINTDLLHSIHPDARIICLNRQPGSKNPMPLLKLNKLIFTTNPDVIHCHNYNMVNVLLPLLRKKTLLTIHDVGIDPVHFRKYSKCIAISAAVQEDVLRRSGVKAKLVHNGIRVRDILKRDKMYSDTLENGDPIRIVQVSRLHHEKKGQDLALYALSDLKKKGMHSFEIDFIGEGASQDYLQGLARELGLYEQVRFLGQRDRAYIYSHLKEYDLLLQPSLYEGFGLTVAEAMAGWLPVLVSNIDGPMEVIGGGTYGDYFESGNAADMAEKILAIVQRNKEQEHMLLDHAFAYCRDNFDVAVTALKYIDAYKTI